MLSCVMLPNTNMLMIAVLQQGAATHQVPGFDVFFGADSVSSTTSMDVLLICTGQMFVMVQRFHTLYFSLDIYWIVVKMTHLIRNSIGAVQHKGETHLLGDGKICSFSTCHRKSVFYSCKISEVNSKAMQIFRSDLIVTVEVVAQFSPFSPFKQKSTLKTHTVLPSHHGARGHILSICQISL